MLHPVIIEQLREREKRRSRAEKRLELPLDVPSAERPSEDEEEPRGVWIVDLS